MNPTSPNHGPQPQPGEATFHDYSADLVTSQSAEVEPDDDDFDWDDLDNEDEPVYRTDAEINQLFGPELSATLAALPNEVATEIKRLVSVPDEFEGRVRKVLAIFQQYRITPANDDQPAVDDAMHVLELGYGGAWERCENLAESLAIQYEHQHIMEQRLAALRKADLTDPTSIPPLDTLHDHPFLQASLAKLGIPNDVASDMFAAWRSYSPGINAARRAGKDDWQDVDEATLIQEIDNAAKRLADQHNAVRSYADRYGAPEVTEINRIFHIVNFDRAHPADLHHQLERWNSPNEAIEYVSIATTASPDDIFDHVAKDDYRDAQGKSGVFYFEADGRVQLGRIKIALGNRERARGLNPATDSRIDIIKLSGHGHQDNITIGTDRISWSQLMTAFDGSQEMQQRRRQAVTRDLGSNFRLVLDACLTGKPDRNGESFAKRLHQLYDVDVVSSDIPHYRAVLQPDNSIMLLESVTNDEGERTYRQHEPTEYNRANDPVF